MEIDTGPAGYDVALRTTSWALLCLWVVALTVTLPTQVQIRTAIVLRPRNIEISWMLVIAVGSSLMDDSAVPCMLIKAHHVAAVPIASASLACSAEDPQMHNFSDTYRWYITSQTAVLVVLLAIGFVRKTEFYEQLVERTRGLESLGRRRHGQPSLRQTSGTRLLGTAAGRSRDQPATTDTHQDSAISAQSGDGGSGSGSDAVAPARLRGVAPVSAAADTAAAEPGHLKQTGSAMDLAAQLLSVEPTAGTVPTDEGESAADDAAGASVVTFAVHRAAPPSEPPQELQHPGTKKDTLRRPAPIITETAYDGTGVPVGNQESSTAVSTSIGMWRAKLAAQAERERLASAEVTDLLSHVSQASTLDDDDSRPPPLALHLHKTWYLVATGTPVFVPAVLVACLVAFTSDTCTFLTGTVVAGDFGSTASGITIVSSTASLVILMISYRRVTWVTSDPYSTRSELLAVHCTVAVWVVVHAVLRSPLNPESPLARGVWILASAGTVIAVTVISIVAPTIRGVVEFRRERIRKERANAEFRRKTTVVVPNMLATTPLQLSSLLSTPNGLGYFRRHVQREMSSENLRFYLTALDFAASVARLREAGYLTAASFHRAHMTYGSPALVRDRPSDEGSRTSYSDHPLFQSEAATNMRPASMLLPSPGARPPENLFRAEHTEEIKRGGAGIPETESELNLMSRMADPATYRGALARDAGGQQTISEDASVPDCRAYGPSKPSRQINEADVTRPNVAEAGEADAELGEAEPDHLATVAVSWANRRALRIYMLYVRAGAAMQVNLRANVRHQVGRCIARGQDPSAALAEARDETYRLMEKDSFQRFLRSDLFLEFVRQCSDDDLARMRTSGASAGAHDAQR